MAKKQQSTAMVKWDEELAKEARALAATEKVSGGRKYLTHSDGQLKYAGADVDGNELSVIVLGVIHENQYYDKPFKRGETQAPSCYAFGHDEDSMEPHANAVDKQSDNCADCPLMQWGSDAGGVGKACKQVRRMAMVSTADLDDLDNAEVAYLKLPVTSVKHWAGYVNRTLDKLLQRPYWAVPTKLMLDGKEFGFAVDKEVEITEVQFPKLKELHKTIMGEIEYPYEAATSQPRKVEKKPRVFGAGRIKK